MSTDAERELQDLTNTMTEVVKLMKEVQEKYTRAKENVSLKKFSISRRNELEKLRESSQRHKMLLTSTLLKKKLGKQLSTLSKKLLVDRAIKRRSQNQEIHAKNAKKLSQKREVVKHRIKFLEVLKDIRRSARRERFAERCEDVSRPEQYETFSQHFTQVKKMLFRNTVMNTHFKVKKEYQREFILFNEKRAFIAKFLYHKLIDIVNTFKSENPANNHDNIGIKCKINFESATGSVKKNFVLKSFDGRHVVDKNGLHTLYDKLTNEINYLICTLPTNCEDIDYILRLVSIDLMLYNNGSQGGCSDNQKTIKLKRGNLKLVNLKSTNNNCLLKCFMKLSKNHSGERCDSIRKIIQERLPNPLPDLEVGNKIDIKTIPLIADYFDCGYSLINAECEYLVEEYHPERKVMVNLCLLLNHYYLVEMEKPAKQSCRECGKKVLNLEGHQCNIQTKNYYTRRIKKQKAIYKRNIKVDTSKYIEDYYKKVIVFDYETYVNPSDKLIPYAVGYKTMNSKEVHLSYSEGQGDFCNPPTKDCNDEFFNYLMNEVKQDSIITAYNGSGFDYQILLETLNKHNITPTKLVLNNGSILKLEFVNNKNKVLKSFDLFKFLNCSLEKACMDFRTQHTKSEFDHSLMSSWDKVSEHRVKVLEYLKLDVLSLEDVIYEAHQCMLKKFQVDMFDFFTTSHLAYEIWVRTVLSEILLPSSWEDYEFTRDAVIGGRTYPAKQVYESPHLAEINTVLENKQLSPEERKAKIAEIYKKAIKTGEYLFNGDVCSLYPAAMFFYRYPIGKYRNISSPEQAKLEFESKKLGIFHVRYIANKDIAVAPFATKSEESGMLSWDLCDGERNLTSVDIENAISCGYQFEFLGKALVWDKSDYIFHDYVEEMSKWKKEASEQGLGTQRSFAKLLQNGLYGKLLMKAITDSLKICGNIDDLSEFMAKHEIVDWNIFGEMLLVNGECRDEDKEKRIKKPTQLGAFVLAYSRTIMLNYIKTMAPNLDFIPFFYTDTDSLHIHGSYVAVLTKHGIIGSKLGQLSNDTPGNGIIVREINLGPKLYAYWYITPDGEYREVMKAKGIKKKLLETKFYEYRLANQTSIYDKVKTVKTDSPSFDKAWAELRGIQEDRDDNFVVEWNALKKYTKSVPSADKENFGHFTIKSVNMKRTFAKNVWDGMTLKNNVFLPKSSTLLNTDVRERNFSTEGKLGPIFKIGDVEDPQFKPTTVPKKFDVARLNLIRKNAWFKKNAAWLKSQWEIALKSNQGIKQVAEELTSAQAMLRKIKNKSPTAKEPIKSQILALKTQLASLKEGYRENLYRGTASLVSGESNASNRTVRVTLHEPQVEIIDDDIDNESIGDIDNDYDDYY